MPKNINIAQKLIRCIKNKENMKLGGAVRTELSWAELEEWQGLIHLKYAVHMYKIHREIIEL